MGSHEAEIGFDLIPGDIVVFIAGGLKLSPVNGILSGIDDPFVRVGVHNYSDSTATASDVNRLP